MCIRDRYKDIYLVRNANLFKLYNFSDGRATEPDFVLFLKKEDDKDWIQYQVFVAVSYTHLAHHINAWTKSKLNKKEAQEKNTWEGTVMEIFNSNEENIMLEYTATIDLNNQEIWKKYKDRLIYEYSLKEFRQDGYSLSLIHI